jgi:hypothetical protein
VLAESVPMDDHGDGYGEHGDGHGNGHAEHAAITPAGDHAPGDEEPGG